METRLEYDDSDKHAITKPKHGVYNYHRRAILSAVLINVVTVSNHLYVPPWAYIIRYHKSVSSSFSITAGWIFSLIARWLRDRWLSCLRKLLHLQSGNRIM